MGTEMNTHDNHVAIQKVLVKSETARLTPVVAQKVNKDLIKKETPIVQKEVTAAAEKHVAQTKDKVLKKLHAAFLDKATAKLTPEMNKKLAKEVPKTLKSTTFLAKLKAAAVKLKETIRAKMMDELKPAVAQAAKLKYKTLAKEQKKVLTKKVIAAKDAQLKKEMAEQTHTEKLKKPVTKKLTTT